MIEYFTYYGQHINMKGHFSTCIVIRGSEHSLFFGLPYRNRAVKWNLSGLIDFSIQIYSDSNAENGITLDTTTH